MKEKTYVEDVDRNMYDFRNDEKDAYRIKNGLTEDIVEKISEEKHDPEWMHDFRLNSLKVYNEMKGSLISSGTSDQSPFIFVLART